MKKLVLVTALAVAMTSVTAFGQGQINFNTTAPTVITVDATAGAALGIAAGSKAPAAKFSAAVYCLKDAGTTPAESALEAGKAGAKASVLSGGMVVGGNRTVTGIGQGESGWFQIRVWENAYGNTYEEALASAAIGGRLSIAGVSKVGKMTLPTGVNLPESVFAVLGGPVVSVVPEPSTFALGLLGLAGLFLLRRRS